MRRFKPSFSTFALSIDTDIIRTVFAQLVRPSVFSSATALSIEKPKRSSR